MLLNIQTWGKCAKTVAKQVTDPLECSLKQTVCPKHGENARKIEKSRVFLENFQKKYSVLEVRIIPYWRLFI